MAEYRGTSKRFKGLYAAAGDIAGRGTGDLLAPSPSEGEITIGGASRTSAATNKTWCSRWATAPAVPHGARSSNAANLLAPSLLLSPHPVQAGEQGAPFVFPSRRSVRSSSELRPATDGWRHRVHRATATARVVFPETDRADVVAAGRLPKNEVATARARKQCLGLVHVCQSTDHTIPKLIASDP